MAVPASLAAKRRPESRIDTAIAILKQKFGERLSTAEAVRQQHGKGEDHFPVLPPDAVVFAETTEDVAEAVRVCAEHKVPVIPFGTGTSLEGHVGAIEGG
ncbi:MAG: FAD-binding oxidoreductase, partial [Candidatus Odyssella sp.]|nr:FAD-binding oxidoreductase [Candidatus Odyssella sp.]